MYFQLEPKLQKARFARNPKTNEKIYVKRKIFNIFLNHQKCGQKK